MTRQVLRDRTGVDFTSNGIAMTGGSVVPALAANFSSVQLFNPVGSGINIILQRARVESTSYFIAPTTTALSVLTTDSFNKLVPAGPNFVGEIRTDQTGSIPTVTRSIGIRAPASVGITEVIDTPIPGILSPGSGLVAFTTATNQQISGLFEWVEVDV